METKRNTNYPLVKRITAIFFSGSRPGGRSGLYVLVEHLERQWSGRDLTTINNPLFQDITAEGAERAFWHLLFYIITVIKVLQLGKTSSPLLVFTSILLAIGSIVTPQLWAAFPQRLFWFPAVLLLALLLAGCVGYMVLTPWACSTLHRGFGRSQVVPPVPTPNVVLNIILQHRHCLWQQWSSGFPVFLAVAIGLEHEHLGESHRNSAPPAGREVNDVVVVAPELIVSNFAPFAVFVLLTCTFAIYGIDYPKPALVHVVVGGRYVGLPGHCLPAGHCTGWVPLDPFTFHPKDRQRGSVRFLHLPSSAATPPPGTSRCARKSSA